MWDFTGPESNDKARTSSRLAELQPIDVVQSDLRVSHPFGVLMGFDATEWITGSYVKPIEIVWSEPVFPTKPLPPPSRGRGQGRLCQACRFFCR